MPDPHPPPAPTPAGWPGLDVVVRSTHVDLFGHLNHARYLEFMEWARFAWAEHHGFPMLEMVETQRIGPALLRVDIQFRRECRLGDSLVVSVTPLSARRRIGRLRQDIVDRATGERVCEAEITFVMFDLDARRAVALPDAFRAMLAEGPDPA